MILDAFLQSARQRLAQAGVETPAVDVRVLAAAALGLDRAALLTQGGRVLSAEEEARLTLYIERRCAREPVARILGARAFWGHDFALNEATLEPRPDTETLVETALQMLAARRDAPLRVLDLGTGTGAILLSLLGEWEKATGLGVDIAPRAIEQARQNAAALGLDARASFQLGDWLAGVTGRFDVIVSNPPYIPAGEIPELMPEVRCYDPRAALDGGADGLAPYRHLAPLLPDYLQPQGVVLFEVGQGQAADVAALLARAGLKPGPMVQDLAGIDRCVTARR